MRKYFKPMKRAPKKKVKEVSVLDYFKTVKVTKAGETTPKVSKYFKKNISSPKTKAVKAEKPISSPKRDPAKTKAKSPKTKPTNTKAKKPISSPKTKPIKTEKLTDLTIKKDQNLGIHKKRVASSLFGPPPPSKKKRVNPSGPFGYSKPKKRVDPSSLFGSPKKKTSRVDTGTPSDPFDLKKKVFTSQSTNSGDIPKKEESTTAIKDTPKSPSKYPECEPWCLVFKNIFFTGRFDGWTDLELKTLVIRNGGRVVTEVSIMTSYVIIGDNPEHKSLDIAKCPSLSLTDFLKLLPTLPQRAAPKIRKKKTKIEMLWVDKYKPKSLSELVGNGHLVKRLQNYLKSWPRLRNAKKGTAKRACLLSGPPGVGKSCTATLVANAMGYRVLEFNASDARGRKVLQEQVKAATDHHSLSEFSQIGKKRDVRQAVIIMDEVDGMSSGDRGGVTQLIEFIKESKTPIFCICNDRAKDSIRSLANHCEDLRFRKPNAEAIASRMLNVCRSEGLTVSREYLIRMITGLNGDLRQVINLLQLWSNTPDKLMDTSLLTKRMESARKDVTLGPWDVVPKFFTLWHKVAAKNRIYRGTEWYFVDQMIVPLFIFENYLQGSWNDCRANVINDFADAAESFADGDIVDNIIRQKQDYSFMPMFATLFCIKPCLLTGQVRGVHDFGRVNFPMWLGKNSKRNKNLRILSSVCHHMSSEVTGSNSSVMQDYLPLLRRRLSEPMVKKGSEGITEVVEMLKAYQLSREDWEMITNELDVDLTKVLPDVYDAINIPGKVKTKFTKTCKDENVMIYSEVRNKSLTTFRALANEKKEEAEGLGEKKEKQKKATDSMFFKKKKVPKKKGKKRKATKRKR